MDDDLQQFAAMFEDEADLRKSIAGLLRRMDRAAGVEITHGGHERGKDIIFYRAGRAGRIGFVRVCCKEQKNCGSC